MTHDPKNPAAEGRKIPSGRISRLARLASLGARTAGGLALGKARKALGEEGTSAEAQAAMRMLETLGTMKGAAMKLGQQLAMEADALPPEAQEIVARLFAQAPAHPYEEIARMVEEQLGDPPDVLFAEFAREPHACASLGQVHLARLADGTRVAVKVQYRDVAEALESDLKNAGLLVRAFKGAALAAKNVDPRPYYEEIRREIGAETDYLREARLRDAMAEALSGFDGIRVPRVHASHSGKRVLTMDFVEGVDLRAFAASEADAQARWRVGRALATAIMGPFVRRRLMHADPHPGNFLVCPDGTLAVLDFGAVKQFSPQFVSGFWGLMDAELAGEPPRVLDLLQEAGFTFAGDAEEAERNLRRIHDIAARPVRDEVYDWTDCRVVADIRRAAMGELRSMLRLQPPPESLMFLRALGGLASNLKMLRSKGSYRRLCLELSEVRRAALAA